MTNHTKRGQLKSLRESEPPPNRGATVQIKIVDHSYPDEVVKAYLGVGTDFENKAAARESLPEQTKELVSIRETFDSYYKDCVELETVIRGIIAVNLPIEKGVILSFEGGPDKEIIGFAYNILTSRNMLVFQVVVRNRYLLDEQHIIDAKMEFPEDP